MNCRDTFVRSQTLRSVLMCWVVLPIMDAIKTNSDFVVCRNPENNRAVAIQIL